MTNGVPSKGLEWANLVLGAGLACAAFTFAEMPAAAWNAGIVGVLIACCSAAALYRYGAWAEWSNLVLGCWAVAAPFLLGFGSAQAAMWTHVLVGLCVATIAIIQLSSGRKAQMLSSIKSDDNIIDGPALGGRRALFPRPSSDASAVASETRKPSRQGKRS